MPRKKRMKKNAKEDRSEHIDKEQGKENKEMKKRK
jgi:hypothetical protein